MSYLPVLEMLDRKIADTARAASRAENMLHSEEFHCLNMGTGVGVRLQVLNEVKADIINLGLREHGR